MKLKFDPREDFYGQLKIERTASLNDIKRAYRRLALQTHPDVNKAPDAAETFKKVCRAYKVLSDPDARRQYDMMRGAGAAGAPGARRTAAGSAGSGGGSSSGRQWYDQYDPAGFRAARKEETADSIDDSFGSIFRDLMGTVAVRGSKGVFEDFVSFLEESVDGFGDESDAGFEEVLRSEDLAEVQKECESVQFLLNKLREKLQKAKVELMVLEGKLRVMQGPAAAPRDMDGVDKRLAIVEQAAAMRARVQDLEGHMKRADKRQRRLMTRAEELRWGTPGGVRSAYSKYANPGVKGSASTRFNTTNNNAADGAASASSSSSSSSSSYGGAGSGAGASKGSAVEDELQKLKKQMGL